MFPNHPFASSEVENRAARYKGFSTSSRRDEDYPELLPWQAVEWATQDERCCFIPLILSRD